MNRIIPLLTLTTAIMVACSTQTETVEHYDSDVKTQTTDTTPITAEPISVEESIMDMAEMAASPVAPASTVGKLQRQSENKIVFQPSVARSEQMVLPETVRENYAQTQLNNIQSTLVQPVSTFSTDADTASYTNARRFLQQGQRPPEDAIRVEEFINYFDYQLDSPPQIEEPLAIETETMVTPWNSQTKLMRVSLQAYRSNFDDLPPVNLVFLLDVSGSMSSPNKLPLMQRAFNLLVNQLRPQDHVSIAVYAGNSGVVLEPTAGDNKAQILNAINQLNAGGSTHGSAGINLAYDLAQRHFDKNGINRIILGTDGDFNVGTTSIDDLKSLIETKRESGVFLSVLGFGTGNYNDFLMEELSNHGNGNAYYIDSFQEARKIFSEQLTSTLQTVAKDVKIQVEFNPARVAEYRLIGYNNRLLNQEDFNNDKIDAGEMGSGHSVTALYEITTTDGDFRFNDPLRYQSDVPNTSDSDELAFVKVRYKLPKADTSNLMSIPVHIEDISEPSVTMTLAASVSGFAEYLRNSPYLTDWTLATAIAGVQHSLSEDRWGYRSELLQLMKNTQQL